MIITIYALKKGVFFLNKMGYYNHLILFKELPFNFTFISVIESKVPKKEIICQHYLK